ncbi:hypothetical protein [uncultured Friedmanniella sp.]|uniref:hypothetical protein n=1 Tax=uncultured Friedmanniella sp. TaxID=335381 RepID=UPI0035CA4583
MHPRATVPPALLRLARCQAGALTREQVLAHGMSSDVLGRLSRSGEWPRLGQGVFATSPGPPSWDTMAWAGVLVGGDQARLGARASGHLHGLVSAAPEPIDVLVPLGRAVRVRGPWVFSQERPGARSGRVTGSPPRLLAGETLLDLTSDCTESELVDLVMLATAQRLVTAAGLLAALAGRSRHRHRRLLETLLGDMAEGVESKLELNYLRDVERAHGLPDGNRQRYRGGLRHRTDVGYDDFGLLVELDGRLGHEGAGRFRDMRRDNDFVLRSLITLRYGWPDVVDRPCEVAFQVWTVLAGRGRAEPFVRCRRCERVPAFA